MGVVKRIDKYELDNGYYINRVKLQKSESEHTHDFIELVYTVSGRGLHTVDGREYRVQSGDLLIINYHCRHSVIPIDSLTYSDIMLKPEYVNETLRGTDDIFLLLSLNDFSDLSNRIIRDNLLLHFDGEEKKKIEFLLEWTRSEQLKPSPASQLILRSALSMILSLVFRKMTENQSARLTLNDNLLTYIRRNCANKMLISEIAAKCGYSPEHFSRLFKDYTGKSPTAYLSECRIDKAAELLLKTDKTIESIIFECGFSNRTAFFKKFYEQNEVSPLQFRKNQK